MKAKWIRELFIFSRKERTGIIGLLLIISILIIIGKLIPFFIPSHKSNFEKWEAEVNGYLVKKESKEVNISEYKALRPFAFNPNEVDSVSLDSMGLPSKVISNWMKYLEKGGKFKDRDAIKKIFGITPKIFDQLESFILIPSLDIVVANPVHNSSAFKSNDGINPETILKQPYSKRDRQDVIVLELNSTDSLHLLEIPGIGPVFASRIIRYRNLLGGYYDVSQLKEIYGMRDDNFIAVSQYFTAEKTSVKTFNINFSTIQELGRHPYLGFKTARKVFQLRDKMGKFTSPDDLTSVIAADSLNKLIPYLKFNQ